MRRFTAAAVLAATIVTLGLTALPASAVTNWDPAGDAIRTKGDIRQYVLRHDTTAGRYVARIKTTRGVNPVTARSWHETNTEIRVYWDTSPLPGVEFRTDMHVTGTGTGPFQLEAATVNDQTGLPSGLTCTATTSTGTGPTVAYVAPRTYKLTVPDACLPLASNVQARVEMTFDPRPAGGTDTDSAPNSGFVAIP